MNTSANIIQYVIIAAYFTFILIKGLLYSKKINNQDDFLLAGRNIGWFFLLCTMSATVIGGGSSIGAIGKTYEWGILMLLVSTGWYLQFVFSGYFVAPKFRQMNIYTVAGYFQKRFNNKSRFLALLLSLAFSIGVLGAQMVAFGKIINTMIPDISYPLAVAIGGTIVIIYSTAGGLMAVIHTDVYQFIILFAGFFLTLILCVPELASSGQEIRNIVPQEFFKPDGGKGWLFAVSTFFAFLLGETFAPGYATRFMVGKDVRSIKKGIVGAGFLLTLTFPAILFFIALYARISFPGIDGEQALPSTILHLHNAYIGGLIIAALMSAVMSSADSILNSATAIFVKDIYEHWFPNKQKQGLKTSRYFSVFIGLSGIIMALILPNIIDLLLLTYSFWAPGIIVPVLAGIFSKDISAYHNRLIFATMLASMIATLILLLLNYEAIKYPAVYGVLFSAIFYFGGKLFKG